MVKVALITGVTGQDGSYLTELLLDKNYIVWGIIRRSSVYNTQRIDHLCLDKNIRDKKFILKYGDMTDSSCLLNILFQIKEKYNARNPNTKKLIYVPEKNKVRFKPSRKLKNFINK